MTAIILISGTTAAAQPAPRTEHEIEAAYLFSFARFVAWPRRAARDDSAFSICILGDDPFGRVLDTTLAGATIRGRTVAARRVADPEEAASCHIAFVSGSEERRMAAVVQSLNDAAVLTVSDASRFAARGGMVQFVMAANRVRFEINLESARQAGLTMSSELLRVASAVHNGERRVD